MSAHTPGPWVRLGGVIRPMSGNKIADVKVVSDEGVANARLISASPELLSALEFTQDCLIKCLTGGEIRAKVAGKAIEQGAQAIAKARGAE